MTTTTFDATRHENNGVARLDRLRTTAGRFPLSLIEFGMRLAVGATFFRSGMNKLESFDTAITLFREEYRLPLLPPELAAYLGTAVELGAPVLVGWHVRPAGCGGNAGHDTRHPVPGLSRELPEHLMWASILAYVLSRGPGALSIDRLIALIYFRT